jgi:putative peptidoglycan lipid II flippase
MNESSRSVNRQIARAAGTVMVAFIISNVAGLTRQILVANAFGTTADMEAFNAANRVAETLFNLVAGGALSSAFIPIFTALLAKNDRERAWRLASAVANLVFIITILVGLVAAVFAPWVVRNILAPGFAADPVKENLTIALMRLMLPSAVIFGMSGLVMGILNSNQVFFYPSLAPAMYQIGMIFGVVFLVPQMGIFGLGWGVVIGAGLHLLLQIPALLKVRGRYTFTLGLEMPDVSEVVRLMGPRLLGVAVVQLNFWINTRLASQFVEGSVTGIVLGFTLMLMPQAAIAQSIAIAALPSFSAQVAQGRLHEMRFSLASSLRWVLILSIPASIGLMILRRPIIQLLYQRGQFDAHSTDLVAWALLWYAAGLVGHSLVEILARAFYSLHDTRTPVFVGMIAMSLNIVFSYLFAWIFRSFGLMPHGGLALANTLATAIESVGLIYLMRRRLNGLQGRFILDGAWKALIAALIMGTVLLFWLEATTGHQVWLIVLGGLICGAGIFGLCALLLQVDELHKTISLVRRRLLG